MKRQIMQQGSMGMVFRIFLFFNFFLTVTVQAEILNINTTPSLAKQGTVVTTTFQSTTDLQADPTVTLGGQAMTKVGEDGNSYTYTYTVDGNEGDGAKDVHISGVDQAGNSQSGDQLNAVTFDFTGPVVSNISATPSYTSSGTIVTVTFDVSESLSAQPLVTIGGQAMTKVGEDGNSYTYTYTVDGNEGDGQKSVVVYVVDQVGNSTTETQSNAVTFDFTGPTAYTVNFSTDPITAFNQTAAAFQFAGAETGTTYHYSINDTNGATLAVMGSGTVNTPNQTISNIDLSGLDDGILTLTVYLVDPAGNQGINATDTVIKDATADVTITVTDSTTAEDGQTGQLSIKLTSQPEHNVTITIISSDMTEGEVVPPTTLTFTPANWSTTQSVTIKGIDDNLVDGDQSYTVSISSASNDAKYNNITKQQNFTNSDDDTIPQTDLGQIDTNRTSCQVDAADLGNGKYQIQVWITDTNGSTCTPNTLVLSANAFSVISDNAAAGYFEAQGIAQEVILHANGATEIISKILDENGTEINNTIGALFIPTRTEIFDNGDAELRIQSAPDTELVFTVRVDGTVLVEMYHGADKENCIQINLPNSKAMINADGLATITVGESLELGLNDEAAELTIVLTIAADGIVTINSVQENGEGIRTAINTFAPEQFVPPGSCMSIDPTQVTIHNITSSHVSF